MVSRYFLGIDIGGSKSHALVADEAGRAVGFAECGAGNHEVVGYDGLAAALQEVTTNSLAMAEIERDQISGAGFGIAGYDWPSERQPTLETIAALGLQAPFEAVNDAILGLLAGTSQGWGVSVVAGTGNNCWGWDQQHRIGRITGCGFWFGERGGGFDLVLKATEAIARQWSRRGASTALTDAFLQMTGTKNVEEFLENLALNQISITAEAARLVFDVANRGDAVAQEIIRWNGRQLGDLANGVIRQLGFENLEFEVVQIGSIFNGSPLLGEAMREAIHTIAPGAKLVRLDAPPVVGGVLLGMQEAGFSSTGARARLIQTTKEMMQIYQLRQS